jgi:FAD/FMN-containing dehydrogenase
MHVPRICKGDSDYDNARRISNARFDYKPNCIYYCSNAEQVKTALQAAAPGKVRVRSGGHHHEGMSSGEGVTIIDLSSINHICFSDDNDTVWIGAGARLEQVYSAVLARGRVLSGGGCGDVRVGGLVQGGGWGPYSRAYGLTCDQLSAFRMVTERGADCITVSLDPGNSHHDLFWAVCGGGGGNFGVITEFQFKLARHDGPITSFTLTWDVGSRSSLIKAVLNEWLPFYKDDDWQLTSFCRISASPDPAAVIGGNYLGSAEAAADRLERLLPSTYRDAKRKYDPVGPGKGEQLFHPEYQPGPPREALLALPGSAQSPPKDTCDGGFYPHKVSSCFPRTTFGESEVQAIVGFMIGPPDGNARRYLSLHGMGGAITRDPEWRQKRSCFPYRDSPFMLQYQAWWADAKDEQLTKECLAWVKAFREHMADYTKGAFINFPDKDLVKDPDTPEGRIDLLKIYYAENFPRLRDIKRQYDRYNFFDFGMGIPPS